MKGTINCGNFVKQIDKQNLYYFSITFHQFSSHLSNLNSTLQLHLFEIQKFFKSRHKSLITLISIPKVQPYIPYLNILQHHSLYHKYTNLQTLQIYHLFCHEYASQYLSSIHIQYFGRPFLELFQDENQKRIPEQAAKLYIAEVFTVFIKIAQYIRFKTL
ncbi:unnamed protein product [Paramecium octaurelia]|uniref:Uncharacterized protein n=1 Tax=Paramecium octaurelia TaxID=43137 RepID=A0A8S1Y4K0_PAROT|nr:unnamed protein product [Paramecium octaurelia]